MTLPIHIIRGQKGEDLAASYLQQRGYKIIERNWKYKNKEIDIIAYEGQTLVFVEVKTRNGTSFGYPEEFVNSKKQRNIIFASEQYLWESRHKGEIRYDIVAIILKENNTEIELIKDAFWTS